MRTSEPVSPMTENTVVAMGIAYAKRGWPVFPVDSKTKVPLIKDWPNRATTKPELIRRIWEKVPNAGIGIVTGSGLVVVDLDVKDGKDGPGNWDSYLEDRGITLPETLRAQTRSGGQHRYYQVPDGAEYFNSTGMIAGTIVEGVDIRGTGGFVVAPPTPGYEFLTEFDGAVLPELPVGVLPERVPVATTEPRRKHTSAEALTDFSGGLASLKVATEGERNATLYKVAVQAAEFISDGLLDKEAADFELGFAAMECGLDPDEIAQTVGSAFSKIEREAAPEPSILLSGPWGRETLWADDLLWAEDNMQPPIWGPEESPLWMPGVNGQ